jgi:hypothetical protein
MQNQINRPYSPDLCNLSGTYRANCGKVFYIGSAARLGRRNSEHRTLLEKGEHPNRKLQEAYAATGHYLFTALTEIPSLETDQGKDHRDRLRAAEQLLLDAHAGDPCLANASTSSIHNSGIGELLAARWRDPEFRAANLPLFMSRLGVEVLPETRKKMSEAKRGKRNYKATPCFTHFNGESHTFETVSEAAAHHGVSQQTMDLWMRGIVPWPGTGTKRARIWRLIGITGGLI